MNVNGSQIHLIVEPVMSPSSGAPRDAGQNSWPKLPVPVGASALEAGPPPRWRDRSPHDVEGAVLLEPIKARDGQPRLLLIHAAARRLRVNGGPAPRLTLLRERDQFQFDDSSVFHVAIFHQGRTGPVPAAKVGKPCPICLAPFSNDAGSVAYRCPCGAVLHLEDPAGLECARAVRDCPHCHQPISLQEGYGWLPPVES